MKTLIAISLIFGCSFVIQANSTEGVKTASLVAQETCAVEEILMLLESSNQREVNRGLSRLSEFAGDGCGLFRVRPECAESDRIRTALITLLNQESQKEPVQGEGHAEFIDHLITLVASLDDDRAMPLLMGRYFGVNSSVQCFIAARGEQTLDTVLTMLDIKGYPGKPITAVRILGIMLKPKTEGFVARGATKTLIIERLTNLAKNSSDSGIRRTSVRAVSQSRDKQLIPLITFISENDPYFRLQKDGTKYFPVREEAKQALIKLEASP